jgi:hypothetical protein
LAVTHWSVPKTLLLFVFYITNCLAFILAAHKRSGLHFLHTNCLASNQARDSGRSLWLATMVEMFVSVWSGGMTIKRIRKNPRGTIFAMALSRAMRKDFF